MLILTRRVDQKIMIGDDIVVTVLGVKGNQVRLGVEAPKDTSVDRDEIRAGKTKAAQADVDLRKTLWALHIQGPDDVWAAPSKERAESAAARLNKFLAEQIATKNDPDYPMVNPVVIEWEGTPEQHAEAVKRWADEWEKGGDNE